MTMSDESPIFVLTVEDVQIMANDMIGRDLTPEEMHDVRKGVESGLSDWSEIMALAIRGVTGGE